MSKRARSIRSVPSSILLTLVVAGAMQLGWHAWRPQPVAQASALTAPPSIDVLRVASLGDPVASSRALMLWLQAFDNQPGVSIPFRQLDYAVVVAWLERIMELDPRGHYPLLVASRIYALVPDPARQQVMLDFVYQQFFDDPDARWPWLAHAALVAKHQLRDLDLALRYARAITEHATGPEVPNWARDMSVVLLEDLGEYEAAEVLVGYLLESGRVTEPHEIRFLTEKLEELRRKSEEVGAAP